MQVSGRMAGFVDKVHTAVNTTYYCCQHCILLLSTLHIIVNTTYSGRKYNPTLIFTSDSKLPLYSHQEYMIPGNRKNRRARIKSDRSTGDDKDKSNKKTGFDAVLLGSMPSYRHSSCEASLHASHQSFRGQARGKPHALAS